jgi:hypothetical protein
VVAVDFSAEARACHVEILVIHPPTSIFVGLPVHLIQIN